MPGCIFCDAPKTSSAHIFRQAWFKQLFPNVRAFHHTQSQHRTGKVSTWEKRAADIKVNAACRACNQGWMNDLDHEAERVFLNDAVRGRSATLDLSAIEAVSRWCAMIATLFDRAGVKLLSADVPQTIMSGNVPPGTNVWLVRTEPAQPRSQGMGLAFARLATTTLPHSSPRGLIVVGENYRYEAYFITFGVNELVVQVLIPTQWAPGISAVRRAGNAMLIRQLWPALGDPFEWPPEQTLPRSQLHAFSATQLRTFDSL